MMEREKMLEDTHKSMVEDAEPVAGIRLDILAELIAELDGNESLTKVFSGDVASKLALISKSDFGIFEAKKVDLSEEQKLVFLKELNIILDKFKEKYGNLGGE